MLVLHDAAAAAQSLASIASTSTVQAEVIVVANGTSDEGLAPLADREDHVLLRLAVNTGYASGCNLGARVAAGSMLVLLNDDTVAEPGWLESLLDTARSLPQLGAAGSLILNPDGTVQDAGGVLWRDGSTMRVGFGRHEVPAVAASLHDVDYVSGCSMLLPRAVWEAYGGFDPAFLPAYYEDADLCLRLRAGGLRVVCQPASRVRHHAGSSTGSRWRDFIIEQNRQLLRRRWHDELQGHEPRVEFDAATIDDSVARALQRAAVSA